MLDHALAAARRGIRVIPIPANSKAPDLPKWQEKATTDEAQIRRWAEEHPGCNWGGLTGCILDFDVKHRKRGAEMFELFQMLFPGTYTQRSASGGYHMFFRPPEGAPPISNATGKLLAKFGKDCGIDVRGAAGQVVLAGSVVDGKAYEVVDDLPIAEAPEDLLALCGKERRKETGADDGVLADHPADVARAIEMLRGAEPAIEGQGGDNWTFVMGCRLRDLGLTEATALALMLEHWNGRCSPPWDTDDLAQKVGNAYAHAKRAAGNAALAADFDVVPAGDIAEHDGEGAGPQKPRLFYLTFEEAARSALENPPEPLVEDWLDQGAMSVLYGDSNSGKTFVMLDVAHHIAGGRPWNGYAVKQGAVVYVAAEGGKLFGRRLAALEKAHGGKAPIFVVPCPVDLLRPQGDLKPLIEMIAEIEAKSGKVVLVVIDTLSRALAGGDENSSVDMGAFIKNMDRLRHAAQAHLAIVHHTGKDKAKGGRGWSGMRAAVDTEMEIDEGVLRATKQRDMEYGPALAFKLASVELGHVGKRRITSAVVEWRGEFEADIEAAEAAAAAITRGLEKGTEYTLQEVRAVMTVEERKALGSEKGGHVGRKLRAEFGDAAEIMTDHGVLCATWSRGRNGAKLKLKG